MTRRIGLGITIGILAAVAPLVARAQYWQPPPRQPASPPGQPMPPPGQGYVQPRPPMAGPDQPVVPRNPSLHRRPQPHAPATAPFTLTPHEQAQVDWVLRAWEQRSAGIKTFECKFTRFEYDGVFGDPNKPRFIDEGRIKYAAPDKGMFQVDGPRAEHWICDGTSFFEYNFQKKQLIQHKLPPELQGKAIADGPFPLPFLFGAKPEKLKQRYFLRLVTPQGIQGQVWLEAWPRFQQDAANFKQAQLILTTGDMQPFALQSNLPNGKSRTVFRLTDIEVNTNDLLRFLKGDAFRARTPLGWKIVKEPPAATAARPPAPGG